ncbi:MULTISPECIES: VCBS repeat-containing protein [unclassified Streptomyces]|uniref:FG-GAP repeat domain-containing protein n=1 Tax=unclassified Streptomyces TaxID=2593676 RepID=UPI0006FF9E88|nr:MULTISPECIES: VCBS repeat-containing protein [unclassified Streptomyces]KQX59280.1 hypothetical protein ASD33_03015 [Streptomyces sp. Root1304]KRB00541.1 hypothetical protein ASE09_03015 [Streptomyces sp. Root66D1]
MPVSSSQRLTAAVAVAVAVALGATALSTPVFAAPATAPAATAPAATTADGVVSLPGAAGFRAVGASGLLTDEPAGDRVSLRWTSTADGTSRLLPGTFPSYGTALAGFSDTVVVSDPDGGRSYRVYDMASPGDTYRTVTPRTGLGLRAAVGPALLFVAPTAADGSGGLRLVRSDGDTGTDLPVTGLPADAGVLRVVPASASTALVHYAAADANAAVHHYLAVVDTVSASVVERREVSAGTLDFVDMAASGSRLAWVEHHEGPSSPAATLMYAERGDGTAPAVEGPALLGNNTHIGVVGSWLTSANPGGDTATAPSASYALTAFNTVDGSRVTLLDHASASLPAPDGSLFVRGGTVDRGEGIYRVAADGNTITATLVASTGKPTALTLLKSGVPALAVIDGNQGAANLTWTLSRYQARVTVTLRHVLTGRTVTESYDSAGRTESGTGYVQMLWNGRTGTGETAPAGAYTWQLDARPLNGIGPDVHESGGFELTRRTYPHDFNDNTTTDLLAMDYSGFLYRDDTYPNVQVPGGVAARRAKIGEGFRAYDRIEATGNIGGAAHGDFVARDTTGVLWGFLGKGDGTFAPRVRIGGGWNTYASIAAGSDLTGDGRPDLVGVDKAGDLWLHKGTGKWDTPYAPRTRMGVGWGVYNEITAVGDLAGGAAGDLLARDRDGVLWSFLGKGDGTFAPRTRIGGGWNAYTQLVGAGDLDKDGRVDLIGYGAGGAYVYRGTGAWATPLRVPPAASPLLSNDGGPFIVIA